MREFLSIIVGLAIMAIAMVVGCCKTIILNPTKLEDSEEYVKAHKSQPKDTTEEQHEITFDPRTSEWEEVNVVVQGDTIFVTM